MSAPQTVAPAPDPAQPPTDWAAIARAVGEHAAAFAGGCFLLPVVVRSIADVGIVGALVVIAAGGCVLGWAFNGRRVATLAGLIVSVLAVTTIQGNLPPSPPGENDSMLGLVESASFATFLFGGAAGVYAGGALVRAPSRLGFGGWILGGAGTVTVTAACITLGVQAVVPPRASFELPLPAGWHAVGAEPDGWDPIAGRDFAAIEGDAGPAGSTAPPSIGVSVVQSAGDDASCHGAMRMRNDPSPYYQGTIVGTADVAFEVGKAERVIRQLDDAGGLLYAYELARSRQVGVLSERLCYVVALVVPAESRIDAMAADAIVGAIRFR